MRRRPPVGVRASEHGRAVYEWIGPLDGRAVAYLNGRASDHLRRQTLASWYGRHGARHAWVEYRRLRVSGRATVRP